MECPSLLYGMIDTRSYLNIDDMNGRGLGGYPEITGDHAIDFALFKIASYGQTEQLSDRINFVRELGDTCRELGPYAEEFIIPVIFSLVRSI